MVGGGTAGLVAAAVAAKLGAHVSLVEADAMGGDCLNRGCVPSKALIAAARLVHGARRARALGLLAGDGAPDPAAAFRHVRASIAAVAPHDSAERFRGFGVDVRFGTARLASPHAVEVAGERIDTRAIIVATGSVPSVPALPGLVLADYVTADTVWSLETLPPRLLILGGGPVACELAQACARLGAAVVIVQKGARLLEREDDDAADLVRTCLEREGVRVLTGSTALAVEGEAGQRHLRLRQDGAERTLPFDRMLVAAGRTPRTAGLGLDALGIGLAPGGTIATDAHLRTAVRSVWACGDVRGPWQFTHAAAHAGWHASVNALFAPVLRLSPERAAMPRVTFTDPELACVGLTERDAAARGVRVEVTRRGLGELDRAIVDGERDGFVKVLTAPGRGRVLGVAIVAPRAGEMLAEWVLAMGRGRGVASVFGHLHPYPTYTDASRDAAGDWRLRHAPLWLLPALRRYHRWRRGDR